MENKTVLLKWSRVVNACQHIDRKIEFGPGLTAIVGMNGVGKTNFMELTRACITNDFGPMGGTKQVNIRRGKQEDEPSFIETAGTLQQVSCGAFAHCIMLRLPCR